MANFIEDIQMSNGLTDVFLNVLAAAALCAIIYWLYCRGIMISKNIVAALFLFRPGRDSDRVKLGSCTGWVRRVGQFHGTGRYEFSLDARLSQGSAEVFLLDREKRQVLRLDRHSPAGTAELEGQNRYHIRWEFKSASGECELRWRELEP